LQVESLKRGLKSVKNIKRIKIIVALFLPTVIPPPFLKKEGLGFIFLPIFTMAPSLRKWGIASNSHCNYQGLTWLILEIIGPIFIHKRPVLGNIDLLVFVAETEIR